MLFRSGWVRGLFGIKGEIGGRLLETWVEHLREEAPLLAKKTDVEAFVSAVDTLREEWAQFKLKWRARTAE